MALILITEYGRKDITEDQTKDICKYFRRKLKIIKILKFVPWSKAKCYMKLITKQNTLVIVKIPDLSLILDKENQVLAISKRDSTPCRTISRISSRKLLGNFSRETTTLDLCLWINRRHQDHLTRLPSGLMKRSWPRGNQK